MVSVKIQLLTITFALMRTHVRTHTHTQRKSVITISNLSWFKLINFFCKANFGYFLYCLMSERKLSFSTVFPNKNYIHNFPRFLAAFAKVNYYIICVDKVYNSIHLLTGVLYILNNFLCPDDIVCLSKQFV